MPLTLTIRNASQLDNGSPVAFVLDRRGAVIGRAATTDWCLPDPSLHISSRHCEIRFAEGRYELIDISTNGTFLYGQGARLAAPHTINQGDVFLIGGFEVVAALDDAAASAAAERNAGPPPPPEWRGWSAFGGDSSAAPPTAASAWDKRPDQSAISGAGPMSQNWAPPAASSSAAGAWGPSASPPVAEQPVASAWAPPPGPAPTPASEWSSPAAPPAPPSGDDIWGKFAESNVVDWARGGFGSPAPAPTPPIQPSTDPLGLGAPPQPAAPPPSAASFASAAPAQAAPPSPLPAAAPVAASGAAADGFLAAAGVDPSKLKQGQPEALAQAGDLLRRLVAGLVVMVEARARAKSQMGAQGTSLEFDGNNPLKFARSPEQALLQLLNPPERGFMSSERAVEDAFKDLQAHQMATLKAMQGALKATLDRFSPTAIRSRAEDKGLMSKILPGARDAALWKAYEKEFGGVAHGSDEAFMDMFAKEFRKAYEEMAAKR